MNDDDIELLKAISEELAEFQRHEHELAWGLEIEDPEDRAKHEAIKAQVTAGQDLTRAFIHYHFERFDRERRPTGRYRPDAVIPLSADRRVRMEHATRQHLLEWQVLETDPGNLEYIASRLASWGPEHKTLADLERTQ